MSIFKCKMCGGTLEINNNESVGTCEYCGTQQTLPRLDDDRKANLYDRANHFRRNNEYDKAMGIYEQILNEDSNDAEVYWSLVLCRYGIEYVEDPGTHKRIPTINRAQFTSIFDDDNYKSAIQYADVYQRSIYENEAKTINEIQKGILTISQKEEPFDIFICYKETDNNGRRTPDSVLAQELYYQLKQEGFKVFFSRITLEDKLGIAYEPYIFAALNSAKAMVVLGTRQEYFNAVWVKNEWSRYLSLIKNGAQKVLIPAYRDMDPYDLPEEFSHLQAQDMSKLGFMQDLIRGIKKIIPVNKPEQTVVQETIVNDVHMSIAPLLKRAFMFLEDGDWDSANEYCEKVLDMDPECAEAYLGKLLAELKVSNKEDLRNCKETFDHFDTYKKTIRFAEGDLKQNLVDDNGFIRERNENERILKLEIAYEKAQEGMNQARTESDYLWFAKQFEKLGDFREAKQLAEECKEKAAAAKKQDRYDYAVQQMSQAKGEREYFEIERKFRALTDYKDSRELAQKCKMLAEESYKKEICRSARNILEGNDLDRCEEVKEMLNEIRGYEEADELLELCETFEKGDQVKKIVIFTVITGCAIVVLVGMFLAILL